MTAAPPSTAGAAVGAALGDWSGSLVVPLVALGVLITCLAVATARSRPVV